MKLAREQKQDIQCFIYFLFKGTFDERLIFAEYDYLDVLLKNPELLYNCFEIFAHDYQTNGKFRNPEIRKKIFYIEEKQYEKVYENPLVVDYIIALHENNNTAAKEIVYKAQNFNSRQNNLWKDFLILARWFCFNSFPNPVNENYVPGLYGVGTVAVPAFAVWTNVLEIDENLIILNSKEALQRANERIKLWDNEKPKSEFEYWELEQEIY
ncbi:MAG: hypothetical protein ABI772_12870 [Bacteroidota bacterium]